MDEDNPQPPLPPPLSDLEDFGACPFHALRMRRGTKGKEVMREDVNDAYPLPVGFHDEVYLLGHYTPKNAGASCYLIVRPKSGNVLIDAPSPDASLIERVQAMGEVAFMVFTHKDHIWSLRTRITWRFIKSG